MALCIGVPSWLGDARPSRALVSLGLYCYVLYHGLTRLLRRFRVYSSCSPIRLTFKFDVDC